MGNSRSSPRPCCSKSLTRFTELANTRTDGPKAFGWATTSGVESTSSAPMLGFSELTPCDASQKTSDGPQRESETCKEPPNNRYPIRQAHVHRRTHGDSRLEHRTTRALFHKYLWSDRCATSRSSSRTSEPRVPQTVVQGVPQSYVGQPIRQRIIINVDSDSRRSS